MDKPEIRFFGRRKGKTISAGRQELLKTLLPQVAVPIALDEKSKKTNDFFKKNEHPLDLSALFNMPKPTQIWLEIGFGGGEHLIAQAQKNPTVGFIGAEPFMNGVASLLGHLNEHPACQHNVRIWTEDVRFLFPYFADEAFDKIFLLYPDPWPKARHEERRFVNANNIKHLHRILKSNGELRIATDVDLYAEHTVLKMQEAGLFCQTNKNIHTPPPDWVETRYERKGLQAGRIPTYFIFKKIKK